MRRTLEGVLREDREDEGALACHGATSETGRKWVELDREWAVVWRARCIEVPMGLEDWERIALNFNHSIKHRGLTRLQQRTITCVCGDGNWMEERQGALRRSHGVTADAGRCLPK
jgi:hypothetical protein